MTKKVYLCGPIANCEDEECIPWRNYATSVFCANGVGVENPMDRDMRGVKDFDHHALVAGDKAAIDKCSHVIVHWTRIGCGSSMEVLYAWEHKKRIVVVNLVEGPLSPWIRAHVDYVTDNLNDGINFVLNDTMRPVTPHYAT